MTAALPPGYSSRPPQLSDAEALFGLMSACNTAVIGFADITLDDMTDELAEPGFELATDAWLVYNDDELVGYGNVSGRGDRSILGLDIVTLDPVVAAWLLDRGLVRSAEIGRAYGHAEVSVTSGVYRQDDARRAFLASDGFAVETTYHRMRIDHTSAGRRAGTAGGRGDPPGRAGRRQPARGARGTYGEFRRAARVPPASVRRMGRVTGVLVDLQLVVE